MPFHERVVMSVLQQVHLTVLSSHAARFGAPQLLPAGLTCLFDVTDREVNPAADLPLLESGSYGEGILMPLLRILAFGVVPVAPECFLLVCWHMHCEQHLLACATRMLLRHCWHWLSCVATG